MERQALPLILNKPSDKQMFLSAGLLLAVVNGTVILPAYAQLDPNSSIADSQASYLPPEIIPVNPASNYTSTPVYNSASSSAGSTATINNANVAANQASGMQSAADARQSLFNSLMGNNVYPQFQNGQAPLVNQQANNMAGNMAGGQIPSQGLPQTLNNQMGQSNLMNPGQYNNAMNAAAPQSQMLSGAVSSQPQQQQRTSGGLSRIASLGGGVAMSAIALSGMRSYGGAYSAGLFGASLMNYGLRSGFRF